MKNFLAGIYIKFLSNKDSRLVYSDGMSNDVNVSSIAEGQIHF